MTISRLKAEIFLLGLLIAAVVGIHDIKTIDSSVPSSSDVQYNCVFENQWTKERHPKDYPSGDNYWSRQVLASHGKKYKMWKEGSLSSDAVKIMAETGGTANIVRELEENESSYEIGYAKYMGSDQTMKFQNALPMTSRNHYVSVIAKMTPSPDWFSGFHDFNAINTETKTWYKQFTIETYPYDAGTFDGTSYEVFNTPTNPQQPITEFDMDNNQNGMFLNKYGDDVLPVAKYTCSLNTYSSSNVDIEKVNGFVPSSNNVEYNCVFENQWNQENHPLDLSRDSWNAHWSKQVLAAHDSDYNMWKEGMKASTAIQKLAESGSIGDIIQELQDGNNVYDIGYDKHLNAQDPKVIFEPLRMSPSKRFISALSRLSPSPDWFSGFHDFNAVDENSDTWYQEFTIPVYPFDAGTKEEKKHSENNPQETPKNVISEFTNEKGGAILPVATFTCTLSSVNLRPTVPPVLVTADLPETNITEIDAVEAVSGEQEEKVSNIIVAEDIVFGIVGGIFAVMAYGALIYSVLRVKANKTALVLPGSKDIMDDDFSDDLSDLEENSHNDNDNELEDTFAQTSKVLDDAIASFHQSGDCNNDSVNDLEDVELEHEINFESVCKSESWESEGRCHDILKNMRAKREALVASTPFLQKNQHELA